MATEVLCPQCGGLIAGSAEEMATGRRCGCGGGTVAKSTAVAEPGVGTDSSAAMAGVGMSGKFCCRCGVDVTKKKRMKDRQGKYWCYDCGSRDQAMKGQGNSVVCPDCMQPFPPIKVIKHGTKYVCAECHAIRVRKEKAKENSLMGRAKRYGMRPDGTRDTRKLKLAGLLVGGLLIFGYMNWPSTGATAPPRKLPPRPAQPAKPARPAPKV